MNTMKWTEYRVTGVTKEGVHLRMLWVKVTGNVIFGVVGSLDVGCGVFFCFTRRTLEGVGNMIY